MALSQHDRCTPLTHHSDRGVQYCCTAYTDLLEENGIAISMADKGNPLENAIAERVNGILKTEWLDQMVFTGVREARRQIAQVIDIYNNERPHMSIGMLTPSQAHQQKGPLERKWKSYYPKRETEVGIPKGIPEAL